MNHESGMLSEIWFVRAAQAQFMCASRPFAKRAWRLSYVCPKTADQTVRVAPLGVIVVCCTWFDTCITHADTIQATRRPHGELPWSHFNCGAHRWRARLGTWFDTCTTHADITQATRQPHGEHGHRSIAARTVGARDWAVTHRRSSVSSSLLTN